MDLIVLLLLTTVLTAPSVNGAKPNILDVLSHGGADRLPMLDKQDLTNVHMTSKVGLRYSRPLLHKLRLIESLLTNPANILKHMPIGSKVLIPVVTNEHKVVSIESYPHAEAFSLIDYGEKALGMSEKDRYHMLSWVLR